MNQQNRFDPQIADEAVSIGSDLNVAMTRQAGLFAHYSRLAAEAERNFNQMEHVEEVLYAKIEMEIRNRAANAGEKVTEGQIKSKVLLDIRMAAQRAKTNQARMESGVIKGTVEALRHKRDMLVQLAFNQREEFKGELRVSDNGRGERSDRGQRFMDGVSRTQQAAGG